MRVDDLDTFKESPASAAGPGGHGRGMLYPGMHVLERRHQDARKKKDSQRDLRQMSSELDRYPKNYSPIKEVR
jgi:hypothetical protein